MHLSLKKLTGNWHPVFSGYVGVFEMQGKNKKERNILILSKFFKIITRLQKTV